MKTFFHSFELKINRLSMSLGTKRKIPITDEEIEGMRKKFNHNFNYDAGSGCMFFLIMSIVSSYLLF